VIEWIRVSREGFRLVIEAGFDETAILTSIPDYHTRYKFGLSREEAFEKYLTIIEDAATLRGKDLRGFRILVTAGPTRKRLGDIRFLTNPSSGKMGLAIAREATLIHGSLSEPKPYYVRGIYTGSTERMLRIIIEEVRKVKYDAEILAAALTNFMFKTVYSRKLKPGV